MGDNQTSTRKSGKLGITVEGTIPPAGDSGTGHRSRETERPEGREFGSPIEVRTPIKQTGHDGAA